MRNDGGTTSGDLLSAAADAAAPTLAKNVIFMVPDGFGDAQDTAYRFFRRGEADPVWADGLQAMVETGSASSAVTDSAAAATAYATGVKTRNGAIAVDVDGAPLVSVLDLASGAGKATGIVSTDVVAGATLAAFAASNLDRGNRDEIVEEYIDTGDLDVILGGGRESFFADPDGDGETTLEEARAAGFDYVSTAEELRAAGGDRLLGLFNSGPLALPIGGGRDEEPALAEMTEAALARLSRDEDGFFLVVEEAGTDIWGHANDAPAVMRSAEAFEDAVRVARDYAEANPGTLLISVADHETGGMTLDFDAGRTPTVFRSYEATYAEMLVAILDGIADLGFDIDSDTIVESFRATVSDLTGGAVVLSEDEIETVLDARSLDEANVAFSALLNARGGIAYATTSHTAANVPLYAFGTGADRYDGVIDNTTVGKWLAEAMGLALPADQQSGGTNRIVGADHDQVRGSDKADAFVFRGSIGSDRIADSATAEDLLLFKGGSVAGADAMLAASRGSDDNVLISLDGANQTRIEGMAVDTLQQAAFMFD